MSRKPPQAALEVIPKPEILVLKQVPAITAETLESLTAQEIEKL